MALSSDAVLEMIPALTIDPSVLVEQANSI
jgi:hypothetical protein